MTRLVPVICFILLSWWQTQEVTGSSVLLLPEMMRLKERIYDGAQVLRKILIFGRKNFSEINNDNVAVLYKLVNMTNQRGSIKAQLNDLQIDDLSEIYKKMERLDDIVAYVDSTYKQFLDLSETGCIKNHNISKQFNNTNLDADIHKFDQLIDSMYKLLTDDSSENQPLLILLNTKGNIMMCKNRRSTQQSFIQIYNTFVMTYAKAFALRIMAWEAIKEINITAEEKGELDKFQERVSQIYDEVNIYIQGASRLVWRCDPDKYIKHECDEPGTYDTLKDVFQTIFINERDTVEDRCSITPVSTCESRLHSRHTYVPNSNYSKWAFRTNKKLVCEGDIVECRSTSTEINYCVPRDSDHRRYIGLNYDKTVFGQSLSVNQCDDRMGFHTAVKQNTYMGRNCNLCLCTCILRERQMDRYFSLGEVKTRWQDHKVVTGVRIKKKNHIFYIQIEEGKLGEYGSIKNGTVGWQDLRINDPHAFDLDYIARSNKYYENKYGDFPPNKYVYAVNWDQRTVFLDHIEESKKYSVVTGVRFAQHEDALKLEVRLSDFNFQTGKIISEGHWYDNPDGKEKRYQYISKKREEISLSMADDPLKGTREMVKSVYSNKKYVKFGVTNLKGDIGQNTIPYIDIREIVTEPRLPLAGIGLYYKQAKNGKIGGFLGLQVKTYNFAEEIRT